MYDKIKRIKKKKNFILIYWKLIYQTCIFHYYKENVIDLSPFEYKEILSKTNILYNLLYEIKDY